MIKYGFLNIEMKMIFSKIHSKKIMEQQNKLELTIHSSIYFLNKYLFII